MQRKKLSLAQMDEASLCNGRVLAHGFQNRFGNVAVHADQGDSFGAGSGVASAQGEGGDIHAVFSQSATDMADDAGLVLVAQEEHSAIKLSFERDAVDLNYARRAVVQHRAFGREARRAGFVGQRGNFQGVREAVFAAARFLFHGKSARGGDRRRVHHVHLFVEDSVEHACKNGAAEKMRADFGDFARVTNANARRTRGGSLRDERAEALGEREIRANAAILLWRKRGKIHGVADDAFDEIIAHLHGDLRAEFFLGFSRGARDVRRGDDVGQADERAILGRLFGEDIERRASNVAALYGRRKVGFVDEFAAGRVHDAHTFLHLGDGGGVDHVFGLRAYGGVEGDEVAFGVKLIEGHEFHGELARGGFADKGIVADDAHLETIRASGHFAADAAETDQAERLAADFGAGRGFLPAAFAHGSIELGQLAGQREQQRKRVFGYADGAAAGRAHHQDPALGGFVEVDVVHADASASDDAEARSVIEERGSDFGGAADNERVRIGQLCVEVVFGGENDVPAGFFQEFDTTIANLVCNNDLHDSSIRGKSRGERTAVSSHDVETMVSKHSKLLCGMERVKSWRVRNFYERNAALL